MVGDVASGRLLIAEAAAEDSHPEPLGHHVAELLFAQGASALLGS
jgi:hydroxymethylbilane synthase